MSRKVKEPFRTRLMHGLERLLRIEQPFPVSVRGITLYALWENRLRLPAPPDEFSHNIGVLMDHLGLWTAITCTWQPASAAAETPCMTAREAEQVVKSLSDRLRELYPSPVPAYQILHVDELATPRPHFFFLYRGKWREAIQQADRDAQEDFVEGLQRHWQLGPRHEINGWLPNKFSLYDPESQRRGALVCSPRRALLAGVSSRQVVLLANLLQPADTNRTHGPGILTECYRDVLSHVMQWVSNQDSFEAVNQLKDLVASGTKAIDGQVWLNFAVAGIGILLAFVLLPTQPQPERLIASMICLAVASFWFWLYARNGYRILLLIGLLCVLAIAPCLFAWAQVLALGQVLVQVFHWLFG